jgi:ferric-dicitrate binding protein FerR (iron transport regulator)
MENQLEHIRFLVTKEILGTLSEEERNFLMEEVAKNPDAEETREDLLTVAQNPELLAYLHSERLAKQSALIMERFSNRRRKVRIIYSIAAASAAAIALFFVIPQTLQLKFGKSNPSLVENQSVPVTGKSIQLTLSAGQMVDLTEDITEFTIGDQKMKTTGKTLTYQPSVRSQKSYATLSVPAGKDYILKLPDGSQVHLNSVSSIRFPLAFDENLREIAITGEAYIKVAPNAKAPFRVKLWGETIDVLGTEFNINCYDSLRHTISLVTGKVRIHTEKNHIELTPGLEAVAGEDGLYSRSFDRYITLGWLDGRYILNSTTLEEVCSMIRRLYGVSLQVENKALLQNRFTGRIIKGQPLEQVLRGLASTSGINYDLDAQGTYHIR